MSNITYWTTKQFNDNVIEHQNDMKSIGMPKYTKTEAKRDIIMMMKDNNIKIKNK